MLIVLHENGAGIHFAFNGQFFFQPREGSGRQLTFAQSWAAVHREQNPGKLEDTAHLFALARGSQP
jgi:hypothetical protein